MEIRIVIGKVGLDAHDRAVVVLTQTLRDAGMEVIFTGKFQSAEKVVRTAIQEDADVIALSDHCGVMRSIASDVVELLKKHGATNVCVVADGIIPPEDIPFLESIGVSGNFGPGTPLNAIIDHIVQRVKQSRSDRES